MSRDHMPTKTACIFLLACLAVSHVGAAAQVAADKGREEADPILRLDLPGHTGEVRALAFTPDSQRLISGGRDKVAMVWTLEDAAIPAAEDGDEERVTRNIARRRARERSASPGTGERGGRRSRCDR